MRTLFQYTHFFFYTAVNWNIWLAFFMLYHDIRGAFKYGIKTFPRAELADLTIPSADISHSSPYEAVNYYILEKLLTAFRKHAENKSLVDLGCGKGRAMVVAAHFGFNDITGIDFAKELCDEASVNMKRTEATLPGLKWNVIHAHVLDYDIMPGDAVFFMFNPFSEYILHRFILRLEESCRQFPRKTYFLYANPEHGDVLKKHGYEVVFRARVMILGGEIFAKS